MSWDSTHSKSKCAICGKEVIVRDIRAKGPFFCSKSHESLSRFKGRYSGGTQKEKPDLLERGKKL